MVHNILGQLHCAGAIQRDHIEFGIEIRLAEQTANPYAGVAISSLIAVAATWGGLALSYGISSLPPSSAIIGLAATAFAIASVLARSRR